MTLGELDNLLSADRETEHLEFKDCRGGAFSVLGDNGNNRKSILGYCVALGNEGGGKLIFGVKDEINPATGKRDIVGTNAIPNIQSVKEKIFQIAKIRIEVEELQTSNGKVQIVYIPSRRIGDVLRFNGCPLMRSGENLVDMDNGTLMRMLNEGRNDSSAQICEGATLDDLDPEAILKARKEYKEKYPKQAAEVDAWDDITFLNKAKITKQGRITKTAIILLGKSESDHFLNPAIAKITWILKDEKNNERDYEHFSPPFLINSEKLSGKIRNLTYRYLPDNSLFPKELSQYDPYIIREILHNCIAHQDYEKTGKINVVEKPEELIFTNLGSFIPMTIENVIRMDAPPEYYRNPFLATAMVNLNMIDTIGSGIKKMFNLQKNRSFPLPDYDLSDKTRVSVRIYGKILDANYTRLLISDPELDMMTVMSLDKVQKRKPITKDEIKSLRERNLIEGRSPNFLCRPMSLAIWGIRPNI